MRMIKPLCRYVLEYVPSFLLRRKVIGGYCLKRSRSGLACVTRSQGTQIYCVSLDMSETLYPSRVRPARQVIFHVFLPEMGTPSGKMYHCWEVWEVA
jgi:hypothetical protein